MAHEIETCAFTGERPWHADETMADGRTRLLSPEATKDSRLMRIESGLDWKVSKQSLVIDGAPGSDPGTWQNMDEFAFAMVRDSDKKILGSVGPRYTPMQNEEVFSWFEPFIESGEATFETAGSLFGGARIWVLAKITGDPIQVLPGDDVLKHILLSHAHDGSLRINGGLCGTRVVCWNTLRAALLEKASMFSFRHTKNVQDKLSVIREQIATANQAFSKLGDSYRFLASRRYTNETVKAYVQGLFVKVQEDVEAESKLSTKTKNIIDAVMSKIETGKGTEIESVRGTWWAAYNGVTEYLTHDRGHNEDTRRNSLYFGDSGKLSIEALDSALELAEAV
jgi:phage/plasmid-like protein (TIGR03299 family)